MQLLADRIAKRNQYQENLKTPTTFSLNRIFANYFSTALEAYFHLSPFSKKNSTLRGKKIKTSKPSTNCSFKEEELRVWGPFFLKSSSFCRKNPNPVLILLEQWSSFGFCVS